MNKTRVYRHLWIWSLCIGLLGLMSGAVQAQTHAQTLTEIELAQIAEIRHVLTTYAAEVWPGWGTSLAPLLLRKGEFDYLIGHPDPPSNFVEVTDLMVDGAAVFRFKGHLCPAPVATAWQISNVWVAATPVRDEFQQVLDDMFGVGVIVLDDAAYVREVVHEAFHVYQMNFYGGPEGLPRDVLMSGDMAWLDNLTERERSELDTALRLEGLALNAALSSSATDDEVRAAAAEFLRLRDERRTQLSALAADFERGTEWMEGAARYADTQLMLRVGSVNYEPSIEALDAGFSYLPTQDVWNDFRSQVSDPPSVPGGYRDPFYVLGAAQMFVLDRLMPGWQVRMWEERLAPEDLLAEAIEEQRNLQ
ncbi:MAG: hypothetical protein JNM70_01640 [Anaerolineae bacterium]|nr:hypothetical protein [Anaerolineae bacterium]